MIKLKVLIIFIIMCVFGVQVGKALADEELEIYINDKNIMDYVEEGLDATTNRIENAVDEGIDFIEEKALVIINS